MVALLAYGVDLEDVYAKYFMCSTETRMPSSCIIDFEYGKYGDNFFHYSRRSNRSIKGRMCSYNCNLVPRFNDQTATEFLFQLLYHIVIQLYHLKV